jgi:hypothetical protein
MSTATMFCSPVQIVPVQPVLLSANALHELCAWPYRKHAKGCPNFGHKRGCPPNARPLGLVLDLAQPVEAAILAFDLAGFAREMRAYHVHWTDSMCRNSRYWQATVVKRLRDAADVRVRERRKHGEPAVHVVAVPEAHGVNVTETCRLVGVTLEWPPVNTVHKVMLVGTFVW